MSASLVERLRVEFDFDPETGIFVRRKLRRGSEKAGAKVGCKNSQGYLVFHFNGALHYAHRLAWAYVNGALPEHSIDHINGIRTDNRIANLRDVTTTQNNQNERSARRSSRSGLLGAHWSGANRKWVSQITANGKVKTLGQFDTASEAHIAYVNAKRELHATCSI